MRFIHDSSEEEMVLAFLAAEGDSPRSGGCVRDALGDVSLVDKPDLSDAQANALRKRALAACRGYGTDSLLFSGFPPVVEWKLVEVTVSELGQFHYARVPPWTTFSKGSLMVSDGAANLDPAEDANANIRAVERAVVAGKAFPALIATAQGKDDLHVLLDGHTRATAYVRALAPNETVQVIVGYVGDLSGWRWL
jgi:hypothetical protein